VLWTGNPDLRFIAPLDLEDALAHALTPADRGRVLFARCRGCHPSTKGEPDGIGPNLWGIADRAVAAVPGYPYSPALRAKGGTWTAERLGAYVHNPGRFAPGTTMQYDGLPTARDRQSLLAYLRTLDD